MQSLIRERFWIIRARKTIKSILNECVICARFKVKSLSSGPSPLPPDRVTDCAIIFEVLSKLDWHKISRETSPQKIVWKFIPPTVAWRGGWWERLVRIIKELLRCSLRKSILSYDELSTVICDCEFLINSRPLTYISENPQELIPLTPAMFLIESLF
ncbi:integrase catalytic domain-containing protein [Trichonephila inaurata madagascariensis]|uniref:Integrase catalytic domain-containing protein n=1 Tax=Trichonephila inaurata madagascariensis TaxID=2747483 RepID=A0A8X6MDN4_9ARAC|nr:integrase catalytic domain-containing protein [Trichonephila inaurata madagascariensis]